MPVITLPSGATFQAAPGISILEAATQARISLPYSCRTGRCSTCKCKVISGKTTAILQEAGLGERDKEDGWILSCVRAAETDLVLDVDDLAGVELPAVRTFPCRISRICHLAPDVIQVLLRLPPSAAFRFIPGQYINMIGPNGVRRSYSLANASFADKVLELHIRAVAGGAMSQYWFSQAKTNDLLRLNGPLGTFFLRDTTNVDLFFLATGTGIAPVKAMVESMAQMPDEQRPRSVTILWGGRNQQDLYLDVANMPGNYVYVPVQSRPDDGWNGARGHVQDVLLGLGPNLDNAAVYACGSDTMIHSARERLVNAGLPARRFYSDAFVCSGTS